MNEMKRLAQIRRLVAKFYPNFEIKNLSSIGEGMDSVAYLVNDSMIFRFPKNSQVRNNLQNEVSILPILRPHLQVEIPVFSVVAEDFSFVGYKRIEGEFLTKKLFDSFKKSTQDNIQLSLAKFLVALHQTDLADLLAHRLEPQDFAASYKTDLEDSRQYVFPLLSHSERVYVEELFEEYLNNTNNFSGKPVLLHNDLSSDHILIDPQTRKLRGIIDFGDIGIGDGDYDLMYFLDDFGEEFVCSFLKFYPHPDHKTLFAKLYFWNLADILQLINHYTEAEEFGEIEELIAKLRDWMRLMQKKGY